MQIENLFIKRTKELPSDATTSGHKLALKGGYIHQTGAGLYTYSPLGFKVLQNIEKIVREELDAVGCQEMNMPVVSPLSLWKETGRENIDVLLKFKTRAGIDAVVNPTHEEIVTDYVRSILQSYKQLPQSPNSLCLYQIQTKYRDELRARAGLIRCREFMMKDAYSFHSSWDDLNSFYDILLKVYHKIYNRLGMKNVIDILAPTGDMGGKISHEFQMVSDIGEDTIYTCSGCDYRANKEVLTDKDAEDILVCPKCGAKLNKLRGVEVGNIFQLGDKYTKSMNVSYTDADGKKQTPIMGCYGIGVSRVFGCLLEQSENEAKAVFNMAVAPYKVHIIAIGEGEPVELAKKLYNDLIASGIEVIIDTTDDRAGSKFANADLIGAPIRAIISPKNLANGVFEMKYSGLSREYPEQIKINEISMGVKDIIAKEL
ncbi:MAG: proline--tRNA ligase [Alphaproteobacteria bacterium]|nr:proline--tRNA ligase [Alphaproteobacteria bacterium]